MKVAATLTILFAFLGTTLAGAALDAKAKTQKEKEEAAKLVAAGAAMSATVIGAIAGIPMMIADNSDGSSSCWMKVLDSNELTNHKDYERFKQMGLPVDEFLKYGGISVMPPGHPQRYIARNRRGERFHMRQTMDDEDYKRFHMEKMPKMIMWYPDEDN